LSDARDRVLSARWAIFDLDGTLFDIPVDWKPLRERMIAICREEGAIESVVKIRDAYEFSADRPDLKSRLLALHADAEILGWGEAKEVKAGCSAARYRLQKGLPTAVLTMNTRGTAQHLVGDWGFSPIVTIEDVLRPKPHPEGIDLILGKLGAGRFGTIMVGNSDYDRNAASGAAVPYVDVTEL
jgi:phosphoglycolate phosphatase-like HAD superfamily hydrolase